MAKKEKEDQTREEEKTPAALNLPLLLISVFILSLATGVSTFFVLQMFFAKPESLTNLNPKNEHDDKETSERKTDFDDQTIEKQERPPQQAQNEENENSNSSLKQENPITFSFEPVQVNIGGGLQSSFIRVVPVIEFRGGEQQQAEIEQKQHVLKDILINEFSKKSRQELLDYQIREKLKQDLEKRFNQSLKDPISGVFFTEFLVD
jgi:flagellar basal body-associated protein FliL